MSTEDTHTPTSESPASIVHIPVLLQETIDGLNIQKGDVIFDGTLGGGGHAYEIVRRFPEIKKFIGTDLDPDAIARTKIKLEHVVPPTVIVEANFKDVARVVTEAGEDHIDRMLLDLGVSSFTFFSSGRGFSFKEDEPLAMTFGDPKKAVVTAETVVNSWEEESLRQIIEGYGEERHARRIAKAIVSAREKKRITTSADLAAIIQAAVPRGGKIHPATKTFQAIRIAVNDELGNIHKGLEDGFGLLAKNGRMAVISFHSLEDRIIKRFFKEKKVEGQGHLIVKHPLTPTKEELENNSRARSAKLRIIEKL